MADLYALGGVETVFYHYADILSKKYRIKLIALIVPPENLKRFCKEKNIEYIYCPKRVRWYHPIKYLFYKLKKKRFQRKVFPFLQTADVIVDFKNGCGHKYIEKLTNMPNKKILWIHGGMPYVEKDMQHINFNTFDKIVVLTDSLKQKLSSKFSEHKEKFIRIYNPMDLTAIKKASENEDEYIADKDFFAHISRISTDKDIKTLIDGYDLFYQKTKSLTPLYIIGDGAKKKEMEQYAKEKLSVSQIKFLGKKENPFPYMKKAKAVILSSPAEGFACVLVEALCCTSGVVVASDCPDGPREILDNGKYGKLFNVGASKELADILEKIENKEITHNMFTLGLKQHLKKFTMENKLKELSALLEN